jgi:hypothetical protein
VHHHGVYIGVQPELSGSPRLRMARACEPVPDEKLPHVGVGNPLSRSWSPKADAWSVSRACAGYARCRPALRTISAGRPNQRLNQARRPSPESAGVIEIDFAIRGTGCGSANPRRDRSRFIHRNGSLAKLNLKSSNLCNLAAFCRRCDASQRFGPLICAGR